MDAASAVKPFPPNSAWSPRSGTEIAAIPRLSAAAGRRIGPVKLPNQKRRIDVTTRPPTTAKLPALASCMVSRPGKSFMATTAGTIPPKASGKARPPMPMPAGSSAV